MTKTTHSWSSILLILSGPVILLLGILRFLDKASTWPDKLAIVICIPSLIYSSAMVWIALKIKDDGRLIPKKLENFLYVVFIILLLFLFFAMVIVYNPLKQILMLVWTSIMSAVFISSGLLRYRELIKHSS